AWRCRAERSVPRSSRARAISVQDLAWALVRVNYRRHSRRSLRHLPAQHPEALIADGEHRPVLILLLRHGLADVRGDFLSDDASQRLKSGVWDFRDGVAGVWPIDEIEGHELGIFVIVKLADLGHFRR